MSKEHEENIKKEFRIHKTIKRTTDIIKYSN